jgi:proteasome lid subunit RPN8/RPN11
MVAHALEDDPNECCGMLAGSGGIATKLYRMTNTAASPYRYNMDPLELLTGERERDDNGWELLVIYHSHTHSPAYPSDTDVRMATWPDGKSIWPGTYYILVSLEDHDNPDVRAYSITDGVITEEEIRVV